jgi:hypothetical protein
MPGVPYTFGTATTSIPLSNLDSNFQTPVTIGNASVALGNTISAIGNLTLNNVTIASGTTNVSVNSIVNGTSNVVIASSGGAVNISTNGTQAITVDTSQNVGIGTTSPTSNLTVNGSVAAEVDYNVANTKTVLSYVDATQYITGTVTSIPYIFRTANTEKMRIDSSGNLIVGDTTTGSRLKVKSTGTTNSTVSFQVFDSGGTNEFYIQDGGNINTGLKASSPYNQTTGSAANMFVDSNGNLNRSTSSLKYKTDVKDATHGLTDLLKLRSVTYKGKRDGDIVFGGLIAEEVDAVGLTEFVQYADDGSPDSLAYGNMVSLCIKAIQELNAKVTALEAQLGAK